MTDAQRGAAYGEGDAMNGAQKPENPVVARRRIAPYWTATPSGDRYLIADAQGQARHTCSLVIADLPQLTGPGWDSWLLPLLLLDGGTVRLALHVEPITERAAGLWLAMQESGHAATNLLRASGGLLKDRKAARAEQDAERVSEECADGVSRLFRLGLTLCLEADSEAALRDLLARATRLLDGRLLEWMPLQWRHDQGFASTMLDGARAVWAPKTTNTSTLAYSWPCVGSSVSMHAGPLWGVALRNADPVRYDPRRDDLGVPGPHVIGLGPTGAGKTTALTNAWSQLLLDTDDAAAPDALVLIDPKGDYDRLCAALGGQRIAVNTAPDDAINVCDLPPEPSRPDERRRWNAVDEAVENLVGFLALACAQTTPLRDEEVALAHKAALAMYAGHQVQGQPRAIKRTDPGTWFVPPAQMPVLADLVRALEAVGAASLAVRLEPYATGIYSGLFGRRTTLDARQYLVVFDLADLSRRLQPLATYLITAYTWNRARRAALRRGMLFVMDEIGSLLANPHTAHLVGEVYAKGRSFGMSVWSMSQSRADYARTDEGQRALDNAHTVLEMDASRRGIGTLSTPRGRVVLRVVPAPLVREWLTGMPNSLTGRVPDEAVAMGEAA